MIRSARAASVAEWRALVAVIERAQIRLPKPLPWTRIPYEDEGDIAILAWVASCEVCATPLELKGYSDARNWAAP